MRASRRCGSTPATSVGPTRSRRSCAPRKLRGFRCGSARTRARCRSIWPSSRSATRRKRSSRLRAYPQHFEVAVLGCAVNGPGEAGDADFGIAGGRDTGFVYAHGRVLKKVSSDILIDELFHEIDRWIAEGMQRPKRLKMAKPAALAMAEASLIPLGE